MNNNTTRENLSTETSWRILRQRLSLGLRNIANHLHLEMLSVAFVLSVIAMGIYVSRSDRYMTLGMLGPIFRAIAVVAVIFAAALLGFLLVIMAGTPWGSNTIHNNLQRAGLCNHAGEAPSLLEKRKDKNNPDIVVYVFDAVKIALFRWDEKKAEIEAALNASVARIEYGDTMEQICVYAARTGAKLPDIILWDWSKCTVSDSVFNLGRSLLGDVLVDISLTAHLLLAGSSGSGKSCLLKVMLAQAIQKGRYDILIVDFKGGVDWGYHIWRETCRMCFDVDTLIEALTDIVAELDRRKTLLYEAECSSIAEYNQKTGEQLRGIIVAFDEFAEAMDANHCSTKEDKQKMAKIVGLVSTIGRLGRFADIHLFASTQSPLVDVMPAQIRNNLDFRAIGRADENLSRVVIGNADAAKMIPKTSRGRFLTNDGTLFQAFYFEDSMLGDI